MKLLIKQRPPVKYTYIYLAALVFCIIVILQTSNIASSDFVIRIDHIVLFVINYFTWAIIIGWVYGLLRPLEHFQKNRLKASIEILINSLLLAAIHLIITNVLYYLFLFASTDITVEKAISTMQSVVFKIYASRILDLSIIMVLLKLIDSYKMHNSRKIQLAEIENELHVSQLESLKAQLNPHFLFNALHAIHSLIGHDDTKAKSITIKISHLLRKMLDVQNKQSTLFEEELEYFNDYLGIEKERFHDRLTVELDIDENCLQVAVPYLILQPLAENAFKHGISLIEGDGVVSLKAKMTDKTLLIQLSNTIPESSTSSAVESTGIGLSNLENRLRHIYGTNYSLSQTKEETSFTIQIELDTTITP